MKNLSIVILALAVMTFTSCSKDDPSEILVESFEIALSTQNSIPGIDNRNETGNATLELYEDNSLQFTITVDGLSASDNLTAAHIHIGDILSTGGVLAGLVDGENVAFDGDKASGTIALTTEQVTSLKAKENLYINVHSELAPPGLVRGQIGVTIDQSYNIAMKSTVSGRNETGVAYLRVVGSTMHYMLAVNDLSGTDQIVASHIHEGATGVDGGVLVGFEIASNADLEVAKQIELNTDQITALSQNDLYINVHSAEEQPGLIRGQIRG